MLRDIFGAIVAAAILFIFWALLNMVIAIFLTFIF